MCGIAGIARFDGIPVSRKTLEAMARALAHRGPDDEGYFEESKDSVSIGLGFRRLSIIDLAGGRQPMRHRHLTIVFNGEIYNYRELRAQCEGLGRAFQTGSDTEVILQLYDQFGEEAFTMLSGMFALAIWDERARELILARDRMGIKPLYYFSDSEFFAFASEMKSLFLCGSVPLDFDPKALSDFISYRFVPGPRTVLKSVKKLQPGTYLKIAQERFEQKTYWQVTEAPPDTRPLKKIQAELEGLLQNAVQAQMVSDVPLGAFLSGGVDSSLITAMMTRASPRKVQTFSIGFEKSTGIDESAWAQAVAQHLGTDHHQFILTEKDLFASEKVFSRMNEPVADPTILPTAILSELTRKSVKVALTGEGGDELFAGYNRYKVLRYPFMNYFRPIRPEDWFPRNRDFPPATLEEIFRDWVPSHTYFDRESGVIPKKGNKDPLNAILNLELRTSLVDRLLMKVDMASMSHSLEARPPYLDERVVDFALRIPAKYKIRFFKGKYILRKIAMSYLPKAVCWRRKHGFIVPIWKWIEARGRGWLPSLIDRSFLGDIPFLDRDAVQKQLEKSYNGENLSDVAVLWPLAVLAMWRKSLKNP